jgi:hypothetical protein
VSDAVELLIFVPLGLWLIYMGTNTLRLGARPLNPGAPTVVEKGYRIISKAQALVSIGMGLFVI